MIYKIASLTFACMLLVSTAEADIIRVDPDPVVHMECSTILRSEEFEYLCVEFEGRQCRAHCRVGLRVQTIELCRIWRSSGNYEERERVLDENLYDLGIRVLASCPTGAEDTVATATPTPYASPEPASTSTYPSTSTTSYAETMSPSSYATPYYGAR